MHSTLLTINLILITGLSQPNGIVVFENKSNKEINIWNAGNKWGDYSLIFEIMYHENIYLIERLQQEYTRNVPSILTVQAYSKYEWRFDLGDGQWGINKAIENIFDHDYKIVAIYHVPRSSDAREYNVWTGKIRSNIVSHPE